MDDKHYTFLAIIPARGGSKGLPRKNIIDLGGKPLMVWTIEAALNSKYITQTVVSSDSQEILSIAVDFGAKPIERPYALANDTASSEPLITHAVEVLQKEDKNYDFIVLLQPTSPLRDSNEIDDAIEYLLEKEANALISVREPEHSPCKAFKVNNDGFLAGLIDNEMPFKRRQDLPVVYMPNGAIYIVKTDEFMTNSRLVTTKTIPFLMQKEKSIDVDSKLDFEKIEKLLKKKSQI